MEISNCNEKSYKFIALIIISIPILWIIGLKFIFLQITALGLLFINREEIKNIKLVNKRVIISLILVGIFILSNVISIIINPLKFPYNEFISSFYHLSYWVSGLIIILTLNIISINKKNIQLLCKSILILAILQVCIFILAQIQWNLGQKWVSSVSPLYNLLPEKFKIDFLNEVMTLNIAIEDPIKNEVYFRFNGFYVYPVAAGLGSIYLLVISFFKKSKVKNEKIFLAFIYFILILCIFFSKSRMVYIAPIIGIVLALLIYSTNRKNKKYVLMSILAISVVGIALMIKGDFVSLLLESRPESSSDRLNQYLYAFKAVSENPIFGVGDKFSVPGIYLLIGSHSTYINILVRSGILGLIAILLFIGIIIYQIIDNKKYIVNRDCYKIWLATTFLFLTTIIWMITEEIDWPHIISFFFFLNITMIFKFKDISELYNLNGKYKIGFVSSSGGHLTHLIQLKSWWEGKDSFWVTFKKTDAESILKDKKTYWCYYPTNRNIKNLIKNTFLAIKILIIEKPEIIISTGAAVAIPFFYIGKIYGCKILYIEVYDRIDSPTITGKLVYPICDEFIVQWDEQLEYYPEAKMLGGLF